MSTVTVTWRPEEGRFEARGSHPVTIPVNAPHGDSPATGFSASELLLAGAGSCSTWDIVEIMHKARQEVTGLEVRVVGQQAADPPWQYQRLALRFTFRGRGITRAIAERAVTLSVEKYCSVLATLRGVASIETEVVVEEDATAYPAPDPEDAVDDDAPPGISASPPAA